MWVMPHIQQQIQTLALPAELPAIETTDHASGLQRVDDLRIQPRQSEQQIGLQRQRGVFHRQIKQGQIV
ncbi:hypothetical protein D3C80_2211880 [compost metagenome]